MSASSPPSLSLVPTRKGGPTLRVSCVDGSIRALHSLYDPAAEARSAVDAFAFDGNGLLVVLWAGLGYHVAELRRRFPDAEILVVEASREIHALAAAEGAPPPPDGVRFVVGLSPEEALREITSRQLALGMAPIALFPLSPAVDAFPAYYRPLLSRLRKTVQLRLWDRLKYAKFRGTDRRVALIDFGYFLTREVEGAVRRLGHRVEKVPLRKGEPGQRIVARLIDRILDFRPDFFLTVNHLGFDEEGVLTDFFRSIEMPVASWFVDSPNLILRGFGNNVSDLTSIFLWDRTYRQDLHAMGFAQVTWLPLATDEEIFAPGNGGASGPDGAPLCEAGFVGNSMAVPVRKRMSRVAAPLRPLVRALAEPCQGHRAPFAERLGRLDPVDRSRILALEPGKRNDLEAAVLWLATQRYRLECVRALEDLDLRVHGDPGWTGLLTDACRLFPPLDYYGELAGFYRGCAVNLNATSLQMGEAVNQRVFDVPASGGFLLTDAQASLGDLFEVGEEVIVFEEPGGLADQARFYLGNLERRLEVVRRARRRVLAEHTYRHRLERLIRHMESAYG